METLKTLKGSPIARNSPVGKRIGDKLYVHRDYAHLVTPPRGKNANWDVSAQEMLRGAEQLAAQEGFEFNCVVFDRLDPAIMRLDQVPGFDTQREPVVGEYMWVYPVAFDNPNPGPYGREHCPQEVFSRNHSSGIWHHKWMWVLDNYDGFDVQSAFEWSRLWLSRVEGPAKGTQKTWKLQLEKAGLE